MKSLLWFSGGLFLGMGLVIHPRWTAMALGGVFCFIGLYAEVYHALRRHRRRSRAYFGIAEPRYRPWRVMEEDERP